MSDSRPHPDGLRRFERIVFADGSTLVIDIAPFEIAPDQSYDAIEGPRSFVEDFFDAADEGVDLIGRVRADAAGHHNAGHRLGAHLAGALFDILTIADPHLRAARAAEIRSDFENNSFVGANELLRQTIDAGERVSVAARMLAPASEFTKLLDRLGSNTMLSRALILAQLSGFMANVVQAIDPNFTAAERVEGALDATQAGATIAGASMTAAGRWAAAETGSAVAAQWAPGLMSTAGVVSGVAVGAALLSVEWKMLQELNSVYANAQAAFIQIGLMDELTWIAMGADRLRSDLLQLTLLETERAMTNRPVDSEREFELDREINVLYQQLCYDLYRHFPRGDSPANDYLHAQVSDPLHVFRALHEPNRVENFAESDEIKRAADQFVRGAEDLIQVAPQVLDLMVRLEFGSDEDALESIRDALDARIPAPEGQKGREPPELDRDDDLDTTAGTPIDPHPVDTNDDGEAETTTQAEPAPTAGATIDPHPVDTDGDGEADATAEGELTRTRVGEPESFRVLLDPSVADPGPAATIAGTYGVLLDPSVADPGPAAPTAGTFGVLLDPSVVDPGPAAPTAGTFGVLLDPSVADPGPAAPTAGTYGVPSSTDSETDEDGASPNSSWQSAVDGSSPEAGPEWGMGGTQDPAAIENEDEDGPGRGWMPLRHINGSPLLEDSESDLAASVARDSRHETMPFFYDPATDYPLSSASDPVTGDDWVLVSCQDEMPDYGPTGSGGADDLSERQSPPPHEEAPFWVNFDPSGFHDVVGDRGADVVETFDPSGLEYEADACFRSDEGDTAEIDVDDYIPSETYDDMQGYDPEHNTAGGGD